MGTLRTGVLTQRTRRTVSLRSPSFSGVFGESPYLPVLDYADCYVVRSEVQDELRLRKNIEIPDTHVIITSDETDQAWWDEVTSLGWVKIDHEAWETEQNYGNWYV